MDYNQLKQLIQQHTNGTTFNIPINFIESANVITIIQQFISGETLQLGEVSVRYLDQEQCITIRGVIEKIHFSEHPLSIAINFFFKDEHLGSIFTLSKFSPQWELKTFLPELHGSFFDAWKNPNPELVFNSEHLNHIQVHLSSDDTYEIATPPLRLSISNMVAKFDISNPSESSRQISANIKGAYNLKGIYGGDVHWIGTLLFDTVTNETESGYTYGVHFPQPWSPAVLNVVLTPILDKLGIQMNFLDSGLIISTIDRVATPPHLQLSPSIPAQLQKGTIFFSTISLKGKPFSLFKPLFGEIDKLTLSTNLSGDIRHSPFTAGLIQEPEPKGNLQFSGFRVVFSPENKTISLQGDVSFVVENNRLDLECIGGLSSTGDPHLLLSLKDDQSQWKNPFGIPGITIMDLALGITFTGPIFILTVGGKILLGGENPSDQVVLTAVMELKNGEIPTALFAETLPSPSAKNGITLNRLIKAFTQVNVDWIPLLDKIILKNLLLCIATSPKGFQNPFDGKTYKGLIVNADINFFGLETKTVLQFNYETGIFASAELGSPIGIRDILRISDTSGKKGPIVMIDTTGINGTPNEKKYFYLSAAVSIFNLKQETEILVLDNGFSFTLHFSLGTIADFDMNCTLEGTKKLEATATLKFDISNIKIQWEGVSLNLNVSISGDTKIRITPDEFHLSMVASFSIFGNHLTISLETNALIKDLKELPTLLIKDIQNKGWNYLKSQLIDPGEFLKMCKNGILEFTGEVGNFLKETFQDISVDDFVKAFQKAEYNVEEAIVHLQHSFDSARHQIAGLLKNANYAVTDIASGLRGVLGFNDEEIFEQLIDINIPSFDIGATMFSLFNWDSNTLAVRMKLKGFAVQDVAALVQGLFQMDNDGLSTVLKNAGYSINEITSTFQEMFHIDLNSIVKSLHVSGFSTEEITDLCKNSFNMTNAVDIGDMLERAGVSSVHIEHVIKIKFPEAVTKWTPVTSLNKAGEQIKRIKKLFS
ncbi:hypothetical protein [Bacillus halotolerans]|uniref:hypothetical protein n=1 Tax=Bacillus halotolerans TaxID=260554 RepID=UPI0024106F59|nr:hypothetical protein [Bacillus halotolerans]MDG3075995.1 hypothetical protein [Bacillus halotolerans]